MNRPVTGSYPQGTVIGSRRLLEHAVLLAVVLELGKDNERFNPSA